MEESWREAVCGLGVGQAPCVGGCLSSTGAHSIVIQALHVFDTFENSLCTGHLVSDLSVEPSLIIIKACWDCPLPSPLIPSPPLPSLLGAVAGSSEEWQLSPPNLALRLVCGS